MKRGESSDGAMTFPAAEWGEVAPEVQGVDAARLDDAARFLAAHCGSDGIAQLLIARNGRIMWKGENIDALHGVWSCTKSFTSTALGLLIGAGKCQLNDRACDHLPELEQHYPEVTLRHFATMTSGYRALKDEPDGEYLHGPSPTPFDPSPEPLFAPGTQYAYWDSAMNQFANVLTRVAGEPLAELFRRRIADPIGMDPGQWAWGDFGEVDGIVVNGGSGNWNRHVSITARQMARFGHLLLNRGRWEGRELIDAGWVAQATSVQVPASMPLGHPQSGIDGPGVYGYNWWVNGLQPDGQRRWPEAPLGTFCATGLNNNRMFVIAEWGVVIVRLGLDGETGRPAEAIYDRFLSMVGKALE